MFSSNYHILATIAAVATATVAIIFLALSDTDQSLRTSGSRQLQSAFDPKTVTAKSTTSDLLSLMDDDINIWGTPSKLTSFNYKWNDDQCPSTLANNDNDNDNSPTKPKKRVAFCLYGGLGPLTSRDNNYTSVDAEINSLSNTDWTAKFYDMNLFPQGTNDDDEDVEVDLFIHTWSETYYCTLVKSYDDTRFTVRSVIAESNEKHMKELFPKITREAFTDISVVEPKQISMYFSISKVLAQALDYSNKW